MRAIEATCVWFDIDLRSEEQRAARVYSHHPTIGKFLQWQQQADIYPMHGMGGAVGPGIWRGAFSAENAPAVRDWMRAHGVPLEGEG